MTQLIEGPKGCLLEEVRRMRQAIERNRVEIVDRESELKVLVENNERLESMASSYETAAETL